jgi:hypothetical protein
VTTPDHEFQGSTSRSAGSPYLENIQHPTSNVQHPTSNIQRPTSNVQHPTSNIQRPTSNVQRPRSAGEVVARLAIACPTNGEMQNEDAARTE